MAVYKIYPEKDASIYSEFPDQNTGLDPILEASTYQSLGQAQVSRYLIKFSTNDITDVYNNKIGSNPYKVYLKNYNAVVTGLNLDRTLELYPVSGSWGMGTGHYNDSPKVTNGVSWTYSNYEGGTAWNSTGSDYYSSPNSRS